MTMLFIFCLSSYIYHAQHSLNPCFSWSKARTTPSATCNGSARSMKRLCSRTRPSYYITRQETSFVSGIQRFRDRYSNGSDDAVWPCDYRTQRAHHRTRCWPYRYRHRHACRCYIMDMLKSMDKKSKGTLAIFHRRYIVLLCSGKWRGGFLYRSSKLNMTTSFSTGV